MDCGMRFLGSRLVLLMLCAATLGVSLRSVAGDEIDDLVRAEMKAKNIPGLSLAILERGVLVRSAGYGFEIVELIAPATVPSTANQRTRTGSPLRSMRLPIVGCISVCSIWLDGTPAFATRRS